MKVTVLGPQRRPTVDRAVAEVDPGGLIVTITAGWVEREPDDGELNQALGGRGVNLALHRRWLEVLEADREYAAAELEHRAVLDELQELYLVQLDHALRALHEIAQRGDLRRPTAAAVNDALAVVRLIDDRHRTQVRSAHAAFDAAWRPAERLAVAGHIADVNRMVGDAAALVVAGGNVGILVHVLRLFDVRLDDVERIVAWSAGAMALTERVVLFHDRPAHGPAQAEVYDDGLGLIPQAVLLPHARRRLQVDDHLRMSVLARRFEPAHCVVLDDGVRLDLDADGSLPAGARVIATDGRIAALDAA